MRRVFQRRPSRQESEKKTPHTWLAKARRNGTEFRHCFHVSTFGEANIAPPRLNQPRMTWSPQLTTLLAGVQDEGSPLSLLAGYEESLLKRIYENYVATWVDSVQLTTKTSPEIAFSPCARVAFPAPRDISVNMLPFVLGNVGSLPENLRPYHDLIMTCPLQDSEIGKVLYLTVEEGWVEAGETQRRGGLHIESPRYTQFFQSPGHTDGVWSGIPGRIGWGRGVLKDDQFIGGLYMASTISNTCRVYHALVDKSAVDTHGGLDHLAQLIPDAQAYDMRANELVWMTDRTPHIVLAQEHREYRQFFRLVTSSLSIWNAVHNTPNPKVSLPEHVIVVHTSRFAEPTG